MSIQDIKPHVLTLLPCEVWCIIHGYIIKDIEKKLEILACKEQDIHRSERLIVPDNF